MKFAVFETYLNILHAEFVPAVGCTEPVSVALAAAKAASYHHGAIDRIEILVSSNVFKNGLGVGIPGTGMVGLRIAAVLGALWGDADKGLQVIADISQEKVYAAKQFLETKEVSVEIKRDVAKLYVEAICHSGEKQSRVVIINRHSNISCIEIDNEAVYNHSIVDDESTSDYILPDNFSVASIYDFATTVPVARLEFLKTGITINKAISDEGLRGDYGIRYGKSLLLNMQRGIVSDDVFNKAVIATTAASDARMAGSSMPVMSNCGSGNQGLSASLPVITFAAELKVDEEKLLRALAMSLLLSVHMKQYVGRLSALCGVLLATAGASCGIVYLMGGGLDEITMAIQNNAGGVTGMICDGAKFGCSVKIASSVNSAMQAALMAMNHQVLDDSNGIIHADVEQTIKNIGDVATLGMNNADEIILQAMLKK
jgi:L-cysteine desulfidase